MGQTPGGLLRLSASSDAIERVIEPLDAPAAPRWSEGWSRALAIGPAAVSGLQARLDSERRATLRFRRFAAWALAAGPERVAALVADADWLDRVDRGTRVFGCLTFALFGPAAIDGAAFRRYVLNARAVPAERIAAALALWRCSERAPLPVRSLRGAKRSPRVVAALALCGADGEFDWRGIGKVDEASTALYGRARLLASVDADPTLQRTAALRRFGRSTFAEVERVAAAVWLGRHGSPDLWRGLPRPDVAELGAFAAFPAARRHAVERGWLGPHPTDLAGAATQRSLGVQYSWAVDPAAALASVDDWRVGPAAGAIELGFALRTLGVPGAKAVAVTGPAFGRALRDGLEDLPAWLALALPDLGRLDPAGLRLPGFESLARIGLAARNGDVPADSLARHVERGLWRADAHPRKALWAAELDFVRDCLLAGSDYARARSNRVGKHSAPPAGLPPEFHAPAFEFYEFIRRAWPLPREHRRAD